MSSKNKPPPEAVHVAFENGLFLALSADRDVVDRIVAARSEFSDKHERGWVHNVEEYVLRKKQ